MKCFSSSFRLAQSFKSRERSTSSGRQKQST